MSALYSSTQNLHRSVERNRRSFVSPCSAMHTVAHPYHWSGDMPSVSPRHVYLHLLAKPFFWDGDLSPTV